MVRRRSFSLPPGYSGRDATSYAAFRDALAASGCTLCPLCEGRKHIVVDRGSPDARVMAIGEGPGAEEDRAGRAFVGRAGRLLDSMLEEADIDPERDVLIANVVKCRPPKNRRPTDAEAHSCLPFLRRQIELVRPRVLVLLGATAVRHLLPGEGTGPLARRVGKFFVRPEYPGIELMALFHPAFILRDPRRRPEVVRHLKELRRRLSEIVRTEIPLN